ncbi:MAG: CoA ester lyase [Alphaproteobacteria bacterium]|nr:CoA ester lyase [Alphaproteobacteria bacterium]
MLPRPRRSVLYMPGSNARALEKARAQVCAALKAKPFGRREVIVRINALDSDWGEHDALAVAEAGPDAVLLPKVNSARDLHRLEHRLQHGASQAAVWAMVETARAILDLSGIASAGGRLQCLVMGTNDLVKETAGCRLPERQNLLAALSLCVLAARANGLTAIDGVFNDLGDAEGFAGECRQGRAFGFDGKTVIHPAQIEPCNTIFAPSAEEIAAARRIIAAFEHPENAGKGAIQLDGHMIERLHAEAARRLVALADAIAERD